MQRTATSGAAATVAASSAASSAAAVSSASLPSTATADQQSSPRRRRRYRKIRGPAQRGDSDGGGQEQPTGKRNRHSQEKTKGDGKQQKHQGDSTHHKVRKAGSGRRRRRRKRAEPSRPQGGLARTVTASSRQLVSDNKGRCGAVGGRRRHLSTLETGHERDNSGEGSRNPEVRTCRSGLGVNILEYKTRVNEWVDLCRSEFFNKKYNNIKK